MPEPDKKTTEATLENAKRVLAILEQQAAGYTFLTRPAHLQLELEEKREEVAKLEAQLQQFVEFDNIQNQQTPPSQIDREFQPCNVAMEINQTGFVEPDQKINKVNSNMTPPKVFISYSHDSQEHKNRVLNLANSLRNDGIDCNIDQYEDSPSEGWPRWMLNQLDWADFVLVICTKTYNRRFRGQEEPERGQGVTWEGAVISQELYNAQMENKKFIPIVFSSEEKTYIPIVIQGFTSYQLGSETEYEMLYRRLTDKPKITKPDLGTSKKLSALAALERKQSFPSPDCSELEALLKDKKWKQADKETDRIIHKIANRKKEEGLRLKDLNQFPCEVLREIDNLWKQHSGNRFGFSIQKRIWREELESGTDSTTEKALVKRLGWNRKYEELPSLADGAAANEAPEGHLPFCCLGGANYGNQEPVLGLFVFFRRLQDCGI